MNNEKLLEFCAKLLLVVMAVAISGIAVSEIHSFDVFWQLQSGRFMVETGEVIRHDLFTLAKEVSRVEHCWLHDIVLYYIFLIVGYDGISLWKGLTVIAVFALLIWGGRVRGSSWSAICFVSPLLLLTSGGWLERPQLWTFLAFSAFFLGLERFRQRPDRHIFWLIPVMAVWGNLHAGAILAVALLAAYWCGETTQSLMVRRKPFFPGSGRFMVATILLGVAFLFVTPYPNFLFRTLLIAPGFGGSKPVAGTPAVNPVSDSAVQALSGPVTQVFNMDWTLTSYAQEPIFFYVLGIAAILLVLGWRRLTPTDFFLLAGLAVMGLKLLRHTPFFYFCCIGVLPRYVDDIGARLRSWLKGTHLNSGFLFAIVCSFSAFVYVWTPLQKTYGLFQTGLREWHYPIEATEFLKNNDLPHNIYNTYDWGGYMAWSLYPEYLVFWDGRQNSPEMFKLGWQVMAGQRGWDDILKRFDVKTIVTRASTIDTGQEYPLIERLRADQMWSLVFNSESSLVFVRNDSVAPDWLQRFARPKEKIDDTLLSEAHLMVKYDPNRYMAWWGMAQIYLKRRQYQDAFFALQQHLARAPQPVPQAVQLYRQLTPMIQRKK